MRHFVMYRKGDLSSTHNELQANKPDEIQFEGVIFDNGKCVLNWKTAISSISIWDSFEDAMAIHGHPEYNSEIVWSDENEI